MFLHYSKIAATILGAIGLSDFTATRSWRTSGRIYIIGATVLLAVGQAVDTCVSFYQSGPTSVANGMKPGPLPDAAYVSELKSFLDRFDDRKRSVFIYYDRLSQLGPYVLPAQLGLQIIGDRDILEEYTKWKSKATGALQQRLCLIRRFDAAVQERFVGANLIYAMSGTLLRSYETICAIVPFGTSVDLPKQFDLRSGPDFSVYAIPRASISIPERSKIRRMSDSEGCP